MSQLKLQLQQKLKLQQTLRLTPQLQLAMKMLQLNHLELSDLIKQEVEQNPLLEAVEPAEAESSAEPAATEAPDKATPALSEPGAEGTRTLDAPHGKEPKLLEKDYFQDAWIRYQMENQDSSYSEPVASYDPDEESNLEEYVSTKESLTEHLYVQLRLSGLTGVELKAGEYLIGLIDRSGYLNYDEIQVLATLGITKEVLEKVVETIQSFDPPGIGARNVTECLLIQYRSKATGRELVERLIMTHLEDLANNRLRQIAQKEKVTVEEVIEAYKEIKRLDPKPGLHFDFQDRP
ncbi:MAG: hypothetical protein HY815_27650, partial [Candidatus Riflebacteria bacterium]|nr:hypothetical protein [Candidatus Riflebacteria bacterium]